MSPFSMNFFNMIKYFFPTGDVFAILSVGLSLHETVSAMANDNVDGDISGNIVIDAVVNTVGVVGSYEITYNVSDGAGNAAIEVIRIVNIVAATASDSGDPNEESEGSADNDGGGGGSFGVWLLLALLLRKYYFVFTRRSIAVFS